MVPIREIGWVLSEEIRWSQSRKSAGPNQRKSRSAATDNDITTDEVGRWAAYFNERGLQEARKACVEKKAAASVIRSWAMKLTRSFAKTGERLRSFTYACTRACGTLRLLVVS